jgi:hypothetical protein
VILVPIYCTEQVQVYGVHFPFMPWIFVRRRPSSPGYLGQFSKAERLGTFRTVSVNPRAQTKGSPVEDYEEIMGSQGIWQARYPDNTWLLP